MLVIVLCLASNLVWAAPASLETVHTDIVVKFPDVRHLEPERLAPMLGSDALIIFDVREADEYNVSRLPDAFVLSPQTSRAQFRRDFGDKIMGRTVVFYCSVGVRSSGMAARLQSDLETMGAVDVFNLRGGIFGWHNDQRSMVNDSGTSDFIHPFDDDWGQLLNRSQLLRYRPDPE